MPAHDIDELRIALRGPHRGGLTENPEQETGEPQPQAETERRRQGAVEDRDRARRATEQDRLGERAMHRHGEARNGESELRNLHPSHQHSAAEREERQEEGAGRERDRQTEHDLDQPAKSS